MDYSDEVMAEVVRQAFPPPKPRADALPWPPPPEFLS